MLCERCGYVVEGLPREGNCPECGRAVALSLPEMRVGSPWQQQPGFGAWCRTVGKTLWSPLKTVRVVQIEETRARALRRLNIIVAAGLMSVVPAMVAYMQMVRHEAPFPLQELTWEWMASVLGWLCVVLVACFAWFGIAWVLVGLTNVEASGIRLYSRVHKNRITPTVALALTAHATVGWVIAGVLIAAGFATGLVLYEVTMHRNVGVVRGLAMLSPVWMPVLGGFVGMMVFETIVYLGVRRCRFANRAKTGA